MYIDDKAPFEARTQPLFQQGHRFGRAVAGDDDLAIGVVELIERVEETFLGLLLAADEMNIVNEEHADAAVLVAEFLGSLLAQGADELIGELLGAGADNVDMVGCR
ncbi:hypothetical protein ES703_112909 [subsurface metagenome]